MSEGSVDELENSIVRASIDLASIYRQSPGEVISVVVVVDDPEAPYIEKFRGNVAEVLHSKD